VTRVRLSDHAEDDLAAIWASLAEASPDVATAFILKLRDRCRSLSHFPRRGVARPKLGFDIRVLRFGNYLIFYRVEAGGIVIARVLHGSRDIDPDDLGRDL
jgi:toxin ParE1/3/4